MNTGATSATVTLYDGPDASHPEIASIAAASQASLHYDITLHTGLTVVVVGTPDVTVVILPPPGFSI